MGLVLVAASVAIGSWAFSAAARTVPVYVAAEPLIPGELLDLGALTIREVRLADSLDRYLAADDGVPDGVVLLRTVAEGELVPLSALASVDDLGLRPVAIVPQGALPSGVVEGSTVDLWFVPEVRTGDGGAGSRVAGDREPYELATGLTVAEVSEPSGAFSVGSGVTVHVLVPVAELGGVLGALAADGSVEVVHIPGAA